MYPSRDLKDLAARRECLLLSIELRRHHCRRITREIEGEVGQWLKWGRLLRAGVAGAMTFGLFRKKERTESADSAAEEGSTPLATHVIRWAPVAWRAVRLFTRW